VTIQVRPLGPQKVPHNLTCRKESMWLVAYRQHPVIVADAAAAGAEPQPHPAPPVDFTSASRAQQAFAPVGAGPPQHVDGAACFGVAGASVWDASRVVVRV
jgi:hypothetical protein